MFLLELQRRCLMSLRDRDLFRWTIKLSLNCVYALICSCWFGNLCRGPRPKTRHRIQCMLLQFFYLFHFHPSSSMWVSINIDIEKRLFCDNNILVEFTILQVIVTQTSGLHHPTESIHILHVGKMRIKLCKGKTTIAKEYYSSSMQVFRIVNAF